MRHNASADLPVPRRSIVCPGWDPLAGAPNVSHLEVSFDTVGADKQTIPLQFFSNAVDCAVRSLVDAGAIIAGEAYRWRVCAYQGSESRRAGTAEQYLAVPAGLC